MKQNCTDKKVIATVSVKSSRHGRQAARDILLLATVANISPDIKESISRIIEGVVDWQYLLELADFHEVGPLIAHNLLSSGFAKRIPEPYPEDLRKIYQLSLYRNMILSDELTRILSVFNSCGVPVISLKGIVLAEMLYENPGLRTMSDIDILVMPEVLTKADSLLVEMGYKQFKSPLTEAHPFHGSPYYKQGVITLWIELHWDLEDEKLESVPRQEIWQRAQRIQLQWGSALVLSLEDTLLFSIIQLYKHFTQLKVLGDIAELVRQYHDVLDWSYLVKSASSWDTTTGVYHALKWAHSLLEAPVPPQVFEALKPKAWRRWALKFLIDKETFVSPIKDDRLRMETLVLVHSLVISQPRQMAAVIAKYRGYGKRGVLLRAVFWMVPVFMAALGRKIARAVPVKTLVF